MSSENRGRAGFERRLAGRLPRLPVGPEGGEPPAPELCRYRRQDVVGPDELGQAAAVAGEHGHARGERVEGRIGTCLVRARRDQHDRGLGAQVGELLRGDPSDKPHLAAGGQRAQPCSVGSVAGDHERHGGRTRRGDRGVKALLLAPAGR